MALDGWENDNIRLSTFELIGTVAVDSGQIMLVDPCYVLEGGGAPIDETYQDVLDAYDPIDSSGQTVVEPWGDSFGLVVSTFYGDGVYRVYARKVDGRNAQILLDFEQIDRDYSFDQ